MPFPSDTDPDIEVQTLIEREIERQTTGIQLIASENFTSPAVMRAGRLGAHQQVLRGLPRQALLRRQRASSTRSSSSPSTGPRSCSAPSTPTCSPTRAPTPTCASTRRCCSPATPCSGSASTTAATSPTARRSTPAACSTTSSPYGVGAEDRIDIDNVRELALEHRPKMIVVGTTSYPRRLDPEPFRAIADEVGALLMFDIAHLAGLVAGGAHPNPVPYADVVTFTTHKTLRGPRGGCILSTAEHAAAIDKAVFPGWQGGPLEHVIAGKAIAFREAMDPSFTDYAQQIVANASALAEALVHEGFRLVSRRHRQPPDGRRPHAVRRRAHRQAGPERRSTRPASRSTRTRSPTIRAARSSRAACASARRRSPPRA